jgi:hypothetical protein
VVIVLTLI